MLSGCKCRCGYCGATLTRRTWHGGKYRKTIWLCITASKTGKKNCPNCKAIPEEALMSAFVESYNIMTRDHKDVLDEFLSRVESTLSDSDVSKRIEKEKDKLKDISYKLNNLLDMHLEGKIDFETFEKKRDTLQNQLSEKKIEIEALEDIGNSKLDLEDRKDANHFKLERLNAAKKKTGSDSHTKEVCQSDDTSSNSSLSHSGLQSLIPDDSNILQSNTSPDACGDGCLTFQGR
jgi:site-specific DNA recombinase